RIVSWAFRSPTKHKNGEFRHAGMDCWHKGLQDAYGDVHVSLDSNTPCWNDTIRSCTKLTRRPSTSGIFKGGGEEPETRMAEWTSNLKQLFSFFVLLYFRICARRANFSHLETLGFGYSSRQAAKNAKFGNLFLLCAFASLREMFRFFLIAALPR